MLVAHTIKLVPSLVFLFIIGFVRKSSFSPFFMVWFIMFLFIGIIKVLPISHGLQDTLMSFSTAGCLLFMFGFLVYWLFTHRKKEGAQQARRKILGYHKNIR
jgi:cbb3-type cytochrome oxidase subunit 3